MLSLLDDLTKIMTKNGWEKKGKGTITRGMVDTNTMKFNFIKNYNGDKVTVLISTNIKDDYLSFDGGSYSDLKLTGSKPINENGWKNNSTWFDYFERSHRGEKFLLSKRLEFIDEINK